MTKAIKAIDRAFHDALSDGVFPDAELLVARGGEVVYASNYGGARERTCFDIASLTKPVASATLAMMLVAEDLLRLDDTICQWLAGARQPAHRRITIRHLLNHTSGLPAWQPYYRELPISLIGTEAGKRIILDECCREEPLNEPGERTLYSDIGYIILGEMIEQAGGAPLDVLFSQKIVQTLKLPDTFFVKIFGAPIGAPSRRTDTRADKHVPVPKHGLPGERPDRKEGEHRRFAPTEDCPWRDRVMHGEVHDQNAYALGGVAGHAGLFSTSADLHRFVLELVNCYHGRSGWIPQAVVREFLPEGKAKPEGDEYALGWGRPSRKGSAAGRFFSPNSIGHLAYTGCSISIDLTHEFWVILLTNRIHPSSTNQKIKAFRPKIHDLIYKELIA